MKKQRLFESLLGIDTTYIVLVTVQRNTSSLEVCGVHLKHTQGYMS